MAYKTIQGAEIDPNAQEDVPNGTSSEFLIHRLEQCGRLDPQCPGCQETYEALRAGRSRPFGPSHKASPFCQSGKRPHCTCDTCF